MDEHSHERRKLGLRVRELRRLRSLTTRELADHAGISASMVSQIETGKTGASVGSLRRIAAGLGVPLAEFFLDGASPAQNAARHTAAVVRRTRRKRLVLPESHVRYELLTPDLRWNIELVWIELQPGHPPIESMSHPGQECALVVAGTMHVFIADDEYVLETGDSIAFDSSLPHRIENHGSKTVIQISAITPPAF